jgi:DNA repair protein RAD50
MQTIIECLKQATTGDLPPNIKNGQAFIHDPKVAGETEVKACVKLRFFNYANKPIIAIRSFSLTQKGNKKEFKTLDSSINTKGDNSENIATAGRCGDIDRLVPEMMCVPQTDMNPKPLVSSLKRLRVCQYAKCAR